MLNYRMLILTVAACFLVCALIPACPPTSHTNEYGDGQPGDDDAADDDVADDDVADDDVADDDVADDDVADDDDTGSGMTQAAFVNNLSTDLCARAFECMPAQLLENVLGWLVEQDCVDALSPMMMDCTYNEAFAQDCLAEVAAADCTAIQDGLINGTMSPACAQALDCE